MVTHLCTNPARRRVTLLMSPTMLPLSQTATVTQRKLIGHLFLAGVKIHRLQLQKCLSGHCLAPEA